MAISGKARHRNFTSRKTKPEEPPTMTMADMFRQRLGWKPSRGKPFHTSAKRQCGACGSIKPGSEFGVPVTPGRPDLNICRECSV
jgi:hypothetical protein